MFVAQRNSPDQTVVMFQPQNDLAGRLRRVARWWDLRRDLARIASAPGAEFLSYDRRLQGEDALRQLPEGDIFNLHWVAGFVDYKLFLPGAARRAPLVWTLHDLVSFTGGCHYDQACGKYQWSCGECPLLGSREQADLSKEIWTPKRDTYSAIHPGRLHIITPSQWLASEARRSALFGGLPVSVIPYGLDVATFSPGDRRLSRDHFGIPHDKLVILCVADSLDNPRKGFGLLREALGSLKDQPDIFLATLGVGKLFKDSGLRHVSLGYLRDDRLLSLA
jgi:glycosyltransferase involved in cell wall biosynthesis